MARSVGSGRHERPSSISAVWVVGVIAILGALAVGVALSVRDSPSPTPSQPAPPAEPTSRGSHAFDLDDDQAVTAEAKERMKENPTLRGYAAAGGTADETALDGMLKTYKAQVREEWTVWHRIMDISRERGNDSSVGMDIVQRLHDSGAAIRRDGPAGYTDERITQLIQAKDREKGLERRIDGLAR